jgi:hypothetical protein
MGRLRGFLEGMMIYNDIKVPLDKMLMLTGLPVDDRPSGKRFGLEIFERYLVNPQKADKGQIVRALNFVYMTDAHPPHLSPEKTFQRQCTCHCIRVRIDQNAKSVLGTDHLGQSLDPFGGGYRFGKGMLH